MTEYSVGTVARLAGCTVRTLHHYDAVGVVRPSGRSQAGYRLYSAADLARLRRVLFYRELDFGLEEIARMLDGSDDQFEGHMRRQHRMLRERQAHTATLLAALESEMEAHTMGISLTPEEQLEVFGATAFGADYATEARSRWGETDAWKEGARRTAAYTKDDWRAIRAEQEANVAEFRAARAAGEPADGARAIAAAAEHRAIIERWFYPCGPQMHRNLAVLYVADERFYAGEEPGFAAYLAAAIEANATLRAEHGERDD